MAVAGRAQCAQLPEGGDGDLGGSCREQVIVEGPGVVEVADGLAGQALGLCPVAPEQEHALGECSAERRPGGVQDQSGSGFLDTARDGRVEVVGQAAGQAAAGHDVRTTANGLHQRIQGSPPLVLVQVRAGWHDVVAAARFGLEQHECFAGFVVDVDGDVVDALFVQQPVQAQADLASGGVEGGGSSSESHDMTGDVDPSTPGGHRPDPGTVLADVLEMLDLPTEIDCRIHRQGEDRRPGGTPRLIRAIGSPGCDGVRRRGRAHRGGLVVALTPARRTACWARLRSWQREEMETCSHAWSIPIPATAWDSFGF